MTAIKQFPSTTKIQSFDHEEKSLFPNFDNFFKGQVKQWTKNSFLSLVLR